MADGSQQLSDLEIMACSGGGAACAVLLTNPLEVAKTRMQMQHELEPQAAKHERTYRSGFDCMRKTYAIEGLRGVQRGLELAIVRDGSKCFFRLGLYEPIVRRIHSGEGQAPFEKQLFAGAMSGLVSAVICNPLDITKVRIQTAGGLTSRHHDISHLTTSAVFRKVLAEEGVLGFWKGTKVNILRSISFTSVLMSVNSRVKFALSKAGVPDGFVRDATSSFIGSAIGIMFMNPLDVVRTRIYNQPLERPLYHGMLDAATKIARTEGPLAFWKGALAHYCRVGPHTVLTFVFMGKFKRLLLERRIPPE
ncbi:Mitochondrial oxaloacetate transport protein (Mitochondrial carrier protein PMT) [Durusdinium trenchii]|uniref:Mitochondrial oxaloacetate transport protein (Mitochondrial carrier protein PMT) n=1 Tax=Durusdinium trenchii TaxID=1381693 RepID=A0ABP0R104_9DINO